MENQALHVGWERESGEDIAWDSDGDWNGGIDEDENWEGDGNWVSSFIAFPFFSPCSFYSSQMMGLDSLIHGSYQFRLSDHPNSTHSTSHHSLCDIKTFLTLPHDSLFLCSTIVDRPFLRMTLTLTTISCLKRLRPSQKSLFDTLRQSREAK